MSLQGALLRSFFGHDDAPPVLRIGLISRGFEVSADGYARQLISKGEWRISGDDLAIGRVSFGPFLEGSDFDAAAIYDGDALLQILPFSDVARVARGMSFDYEAVVALDG